MMELIILGLIVLFLYAFIRLMTSFSSWMGVRGTGPTASLPAGFTAATRAGGSATRPRSASSITGPPSAWDWRRPCPASRRIRARASSRDSGGGSRSGSSCARSPAPPRPRHPRGRGLVRTGDADFDRGLRRPGQRCRDGARFLESARSAGRSPTCSAMVHPGGMLVSINPERLLVQIDRNLGPERRGPDPGRQRDAGDPRRPPGRRQPADDRGDRDRGQSRPRPRTTRGRRSARSAAR